MDRKLLKIILTKTFPVMAGYLVMGAGFGILLRVNGYGVPWAALMSLVIYGGSMQFVGVSLIASGASLISVAITTLMVNARHLFYGISMISHYKGAGLKKLYMIHALTDETYSLLCTGDHPEEYDPHKYYFWVSLFNHAYWIIGSVVGSLVGSLIKFNTAGIDFVMTALFVTIFIEQWMKTKQHLPAVIGVGAAVLCLFVFGKDNFLIPSMISILLILTLFRKQFEKTSNIEHN